MNQVTNKKQVHIAYIKKLVLQNGPNPKEYNQFIHWFQELKKDKEQGILSEDDMLSIKKVFGDIFLTDKTLAGCLLYTSPSPRDS